MGVVSLGSRCGSVPARVGSEIQKTRLLTRHPHLLNHTTPGRTMPHHSTAQRSCTQRSRGYTLASATKTTTNSASIVAATHPTSFQTKRTVISRLSRRNPSPAVRLTSCAKCRSPVIRTRSLGDASAVPTA